MSVFQFQGDLVPPERDVRVANQEVCFFVDARTDTQGRPFPVR